MHRTAIALVCIGDPCWRSETLAPLTAVSNERVAAVQWIDQALTMLQERTRSTQEP